MPTGHPGHRWFPPEDCGDRKDLSDPDKFVPSGTDLAWSVGAAESSTEIRDQLTKRNSEKHPELVRSGISLAL